MPTAGLHEQAAQASPARDVGSSFDVDVFASCERKIILIIWYL